MSYVAYVDSRYFTPQSLYKLATWGHETNFFIHLGLISRGKVPYAYAQPILKDKAFGEMDSHLGTHSIYN